MRLRREQKDLLQWLIRARTAELQKVLMAESMNMEASIERTALTDLLGAIDKEPDFADPLVPSKMTAHGPVAVDEMVLNRGDRMVRRSELAANKETE